MALSTTFLCWELKKCLEGPAGTQHQEVSSYALVPEKRFPKILFRKQFCQKLHIWTSQNGAKVNIERGNIEGANIFTKKIVFQNNLAFFKVPVLMSRFFFVWCYLIWYYRLFPRGGVEKRGKTFSLIMLFIQNSM